MAVPGKKATEALSSSISKSSDEDLEVYCQPCDHDGQRLPANGYCTDCSEHLCETCYTFHRRHTLSRHHTILDKDNMPQTLSSVTPSQVANLTRPCQKHNIEMIKFYCHDHKVLLCSVCVTIGHPQTSCKVDYIPDISEKIINSLEYQDILKAIDNMIKKTNIILREKKKMKSSSQRSLTEALSDIQGFRTQINKRLDELERQIEEAANGIQKENIKNITKAETECVNISKSLEASSDAIAHFNTSKQANDLFIEIKQAEQRIKDYQQRMDAATAFDVKEYNFEPNEVISNVLSEEESIGELKGRLLNYKLRTRQLSHIDEISISTSKDSDLCWITGMTLISPYHLVITDYNNKAVKMIGISRKSVLDEQKLDCYPYDVSSVSHDGIAVTLMQKQIIQFMSVSRNKLRKKHTVKVDGQCQGIKCHNDKIVVTFTDQAKVQILLNNGTVIQTIEDINIFSSPLYVTSSDKYIYVSDCIKKSITKLNWQGEMKSRYDNKSSPRGLTMSDDETVFVCCDDNVIREIHVSDFDKPRKKVVVKDIQEANAICWSADTSTLYTNKRMLNMSDLIKTFQFSS